MCTQVRRVEPLTVSTRSGGGLSENAGSESRGAASDRATYGRRVMAALEIDVDREWVPATPTRPEHVRMVLVSECAAADDADNYGASDHASFDITTLAAFASAGLPCSSVSELRDGFAMTDSGRLAMTVDAAS